MAINLIFILGTSLMAWYIWDSLRCKEICRLASTTACRNAQVQLLDETVALRKLRLARSPRGRLQFKREFVFEFTTDGSRRYQVRIFLSGPRILHIEMEPYLI